MFHTGSQRPSSKNNTMSEAEAMHDSSSNGTEDVLPPAYRAPRTLIDLPNEILERIFEFAALDGNNKIDVAWHDNGPPQIHGIIDVFAGPRVSAPRWRLVTIVKCRDPSNVSQTELGSNPSSHLSFPRADRYSCYYSSHYPRHPTHRFPHRPSLWIGIKPCRSQMLLRFHGPTYSTSQYHRH